MRVPLPLSWPHEITQLVERTAGVVEQVVGALPRMLAVLDQAERLIARVDGVVTDIEATRARAEVAATHVEAVIARADAAIEVSTAAIARADEAVTASALVASRADQVVTGSAASVMRADAVVLESAELHARVGEVAARSASLVDVFEPALTKLQPTLEQLATSTSPAEVDALVRLVDHLPMLVARVETDLIPMMDSLSTVAPDLHDLLDVSRELNEIIGKVPGLRGIKKRVDEEQALEQAQG